MLLSARKGCSSAWGIDNYVMQMSTDNKKRDGVTTVVQFSALTGKRLLEWRHKSAALSQKRLLECMGHQQLC